MDICVLCDIVRGIYTRLETRYREFFDSLAKKKEHYSGGLFLTCGVGKLRKSICTRYNKLHEVVLRLPICSAVKSPPAKQKMQETWVQSLDHEDPLEKDMATHSSIFA